jgi:hypothetical protein
MPAQHRTGNGRFATLRWMPVMGQEHLLTTEQSRQGSAIASLVKRKFKEGLCRTFARSCSFGTSLLRCPVSRHAKVGGIVVERETLQ